MLYTKSTAIANKQERKDEEECPRIQHLHSIDIDTSEKQKHYYNVTSLRKCDQANKIFRYDSSKTKRRNSIKYFLVSVCLAFVLGLAFGISLIDTKQDDKVPRFSTETVNKSDSPRNLNLINDVNRNVINDDNKNVYFTKVSFTGAPKHDINREIYPKGMTEDMKDILKDNKDNRKHDIRTVKQSKTTIPNEQTVIYDNIIWGPQIENALPAGYNDEDAKTWEQYVKTAEVIKMESGCGRMQNRLVTFRDGLQACVRYRQNTDQIQGEIFSFYVARLLNLTNLAPSVISLVDLNDKLWVNVASDIATAQWNTNRAVVLTQYIPSLEPAFIPEVFKPSERHLNKQDILKISLKEQDTSYKNVLIDKIKKNHVDNNNNLVDDFDYIDMKLNNKTLSMFVELAQWSDLIIFDYLIGNLDRIVNNLFNYQWNVNIMDGPAHNLAKKLDSGVLMFLDNESGLLHGYRLLKKYNMYHSLMLENLCVFRRRTLESLKSLFVSQSVGVKISQMFKNNNNNFVRDILPPLPEKNVKILQERIGKILNQVLKCEQSFAKR